MGFFDTLKKKAGATFDQINPFDGGKTYDTTINRKPVGYRQQDNPAVVNAIRNARYGVLANNPQRQNNFLQENMPSKIKPISFADTAKDTAIDTTFNMGKTMARPFQQFGNMVAAGNRLAYYDLPKVAINQFTGNKQGVNNAIRGTNKFLGGGGVFGNGIPKQFQSVQQGSKSFFDDPQKAVSAIGTGAEIGSYAIPAKLGLAKGTVGSFAGIAKGAGLSSSIGSAGYQLSQNGKIDPMQLAKDTALGTVMGTGLYGAGRAIRSGANVVNPVKQAVQSVKNTGIPRELLQKRNTLVSNISNAEAKGRPIAQSVYNELAGIDAQIRQIRQTGGAKAGDIIPKKLLNDTPQVSKTAKSPNPLQNKTNLQSDSPKLPIKTPKTQRNIQSPKQLQSNPSQPSSYTDTISQTKQDVIRTLKGQQVKERGFVSTVKSSGKTPKQVGDIVSGKYAVKSDKQRIADAKILIRKDPDTAVKIATNPRNDMDVTVGNQLLDHYIATGQHAKFKALTSSMAESGTELGRAIHAFADYNKTTPSGAVKYAQSVVRQYNKLNPKKQLDLSDADIEGLVKKASEVQNMAEGRPRNIATQQLMEQVNDLIPSTIADKYVAIWKAGLLTSPRTTMRNIIGNTTHSIAETVKDLPASLNDMLLKQRTGQRSLTFTTKGYAQGAKSGLSSAKDIMKYGIDPTNSIDKYDVRHVTWGKSPVEKALKKYTDFVFHSMGAQDQPFYHGAFARSLYDQAGAQAKNAGKSGNAKFIKNLVDNPTEQMKVTATKEASTAVFKDENLLKRVAGEIKGSLGKNEVSKIIGETIMPFTGVPSSIAGQMIAYSPIGLAKGVSKNIKVLSKNLPELQRQASQEIGRGVVGSGILGLGAYLTSKGLMTGQPKDAKESQQWEIEGKQPNSILIGGKWRSINSIGPEMLVMLAGSKIKSGGGAGEIAGVVGKDFMGQTFLQGVQGPLNAINDPQRNGKYYVNNQAGSIVPNIIKDTAKALDSSRREINSPVDAIKNGIPIARNSLIPKRDVLGNQSKQEPSGLNAFIDLFNSKTPVNNPVVNELSRLFKAGQEATPAKLTSKTTISGAKVELTPSQLNDIEEMVGNNLRTGYDTFIKTPQYKKIDDETRKDVLDKYRSDIVAVEKRKYAAKELIGPYASDFSGTDKKLTARQLKIVDGSITIDDYLPKEKAVKVTKKKSTKKSSRRKSTAKGKKITIPKLSAVKIPKAPDIDTTFSVKKSGGVKGGKIALRKSNVKNVKVTYSKK